MKKQLKKGKLGYASPEINIMTNKTYGFEDTNDLANTIKNVGFTFAKNEIGSRSKTISAIYAGDSIDPDDREISYTLKGKNSFSLVKHIESILSSIMGLKETDSAKYETLMPVYNAIVNH